MLAVFEHSLPCGDSWLLLAAGVTTIKGKFKFE